MNLRSRPLLDLCYEFDCMLQTPVCEQGPGEPCHANWSWANKGGAMKADDCFVVPGCRACHRELDQGSRMPKEVREGYWLRAFGEFLPQLWLRGLVVLNPANTFRATREQVAEIPIPVARPRRKNRRTTAAANQVKRPSGGFV